MRVKNLFLALLALPLFFVACDTGNEKVDEVKNATVTVTAGTATQTAIDFTVASTDAETVAYMVVEGDAPTASEVLTNGTKIEANKSVALSKNDCVANTKYTIVAAAQNSKGVVKRSIEMTTLEAETPTPGPGDETKVEFVATHIVTDYAEEEGLNIYVFELGNKEWSDSGWGVDGGTYYSFGIVSATKGNGVLPNGTYSLSDSYSANTIIPDYAYRYQMVDGDFAYGFEIYKDANVTITDGKIEANIELERDGTIHHVVFEGELAVEDGGGNDEPLEFEATHTADKWLWAGAGSYGNEYMVSGENFSVDVHFQPEYATEEAIVAGEYIWTNTSWWGYNDFADFTTRVLEVDGKTIPVDGGILVVSNEGEEYHIELTLHGRDNDVTYMIEYNGKINDKGEEGGENTMVINTLSEGTYNSSYFFYTYKAAGDNFTLDLLVNEYQGNATAIYTGNYTYAPMKSLAGNNGYFYVENFKIDGVKNTPQINSTMEVVGDGSNVEITINITTTVGDVYTVTYSGTIGEPVVELAKLDTPSVMGLASGNAATVSWNEIAGAKDYTVTLNGTETQTVETAYIVYDNLAWETTYTVSVVANPADATVNAASDAGTATFTTEANPGGGDEGGNEGGDEGGNEGDESATATMKFSHDLSSQYGAGYEPFCYYQITAGEDVIGFFLYNNHSDQTLLYDGTYTNVNSLNSLAYNTGSAFYIDWVVIDGVENGGAQLSSTLTIEGDKITLSLDYNVIGEGVVNRQYVCTGVTR